MKAINELCDIVRETSFSIHRYHRSGHLEKVYENALFHRLKLQGIPVAQQHPLTVYDEDGAVLGEYFVDLLVDGRLIIELKACRAITTEHVAQLLDYLRSSKTRDGLLINFGAPKLFIKKYVQD
ncbi:GxxExxY protein [Sulfuriroseicoccus oceanibius]|uniref:GxxExxY protein n=1 Tax=Sulfuriroseicoccus oceanibius TaxID=2707525 RepID=A0A6B3L6S3_9BACT|nr:GxxExxY protein [Sulfuriroseicoccus oceanibius]QQL44882.1 GxxExxY protein [Sulfuriroseicoccus oceanibius]